MSANSVAEPGPLGGLRHAQRRVVLVPLQHGAPGHRALLDRTDFENRSVAQDHPAGVDAQVPGEGQLGLGHRHHLGRDVVVGADRRSPLVELFGPGVLLALGVSERLGDVAHRGAGPVGDDVGDLRSPVAAVVVLDDLDDLFAPAGLDVQVDVRRPGPLWGKEPFEQRLVLLHAEQPGVLARTVERLVAASRESVQPGMARGWSGSEDGRDVSDHAFRPPHDSNGPVRGGGRAPSATRPDSRKLDCQYARRIHRWASKARGGCRLRDDRAVKAKECSHGTFGWHG
jgi:hypothetical protein